MPSERQDDAPLEARFLLNDLSSALASAGIENPRRDANLILQMALGATTPILMHHEVSLSPEAKSRLADLMAARKARCPISRMRASREFYSLDFGLNDATLDPRPDSEIVVEAAIGYCRDKTLHIGDFGTGSGCLLIAILANCANATGLGLDLSADAVRQAAENSATHQLGERAQFITSDWDSALIEKARFDMIVTNPPYIATGDEASLSPEVRLYDPHLALFAGESGLTAYQQLMAILAKRLVAGGVCFVEIGQGQEVAVTQLGEMAGLTPDGQFTDLAGIIRCVKFIN